MAYNTSHTAYKSNQIQALDCRPTGVTKSAEFPGLTQTFAATVTLAEAVEAGECIAMVRVPRGFTVTDALLAWSPGVTANAAIGLGDPFCCARLLGPLLANRDSGQEGTLVGPHGTFACNQFSRLAKVGRVADGCGFGYTYTCETDLIVTNGYGASGFNVGGGGKASGAMSGDYGGTALPSGMTIAVMVTGFVNPTITNA